MFTNSFSYPNLFNAATGHCDMKEDYASIVNRVGLLIQSYKKEEFISYTIRLNFFSISYLLMLIKVGRPCGQ